MPINRQILGVNVTSAPKEELLIMLTNKLVNKDYDKPLFVVTVNPEFIVQAQNDPDFKNILNLAGLAIADGTGLRLAGINERFTGRDLVSELLSRKIKKVFYLGGRQHIAKKMAMKFGGEFDPGEEDIKSPKEDKRILFKINKYRPDLLLVAYGAPWQEKWIYRHLDEIKAKVAIGVGGTFDYLVGEAKLPPKLIADLGLEWLWRLLHEPWRWKRQVRLIKFVWLLITNPPQRI